MQPVTKLIRAILPHGGALVDRTLRGHLREAAAERAAFLPRLTLNPVNVSDLELIGNGAFSPLTGFMGQADYRSVVDEMYLQSGLPWTIPITLAVSREEADRLEIGQEVALRDGDGRLLGLLELAEKFGRRRRARSSAPTKRSTPAWRGSTPRAKSISPVRCGWLTARPTHRLASSATPRPRPGACSPRVAGAGS
jgi:sulfate adenylyltransferase